MDTKVESEQCPVCRENMTIYAIGQCDHAVCYRCSTRMRALCDQMYCAICRGDLPKVLFMDWAEKYHKVDTRHFSVYRKYKIFFGTDRLQDAMNELLQHSCTICKNIKPFRTFSNLKDHMRKVHELFYCELCVEHLRIFTSERKCYDRKRLGEHRRKGDEDDFSHKGHPLCQFCDIRYLDSDELVRHLRKDHYYCHFCEADGISNEFFCDYPPLREHFDEMHYLCEEGDCAHIQFTNAFRSEIDMKAHKASDHNKNMRKAQARQARTLDIEFNITRSGSGDPRRGRGGRGGRGGYRESGRGGPQTGIVSRDDYEEVNQDDRRRQQYGRGRRDREEIEHAQAVAASLSEMSAGVNVVDKTLLQKMSNSPVNTATNSPLMDKKRSTADETSQKGPQFKSVGADFPTLDGKKLHDSDSDEEGKLVARSLAKKVAMANHFSVQDGSLSEGDFPTLPATQKSIGAAPSNAKVSKLWSGQTTEKDFPSLGKSSKPLPQKQKLLQAHPLQSTKHSSSVPTKLNEYQGPRPSIPAPAKWVGPPASTSKPVSTHSVLGPSVVSMVRNASANSLSSIGQSLVQGGTSSHGFSNINVVKNPDPPPDKQKYRPPPPAVLQSDRDFPSLGGGHSSHVPSSNENNAQSWQHVATTNKQKKSKGKKVAPAPIITAEDDIDFPSLADKKEDVAKTQSWGPRSSVDDPKVEKATQIKQKKMLVLQKSKKEKVSDVIVKELPKPPATKEATVVDKKENKKKKMNKSKSAKVQEMLDYDASGSASETNSPRNETESQKEFRSTDGATVDNCDNKKLSSAIMMESSDESVTIKPQPSFPLPLDTFPSLSELSDNTPHLKSNGNVIVTEDITFNDDNFPSMSASTKSKPPPGFTGISSCAKPDPVKKPPPGLGFKNVQPTKPPPGFASAVADFDSENLENVSPTIVPAVYSYSQPTNFEQRNRKLIETIQTMLQADRSRFTRFKSKSGEFRQDQTSAVNYYEECTGILGVEGWKQIFPELLALLPDINKQQELLLAHQAGSKKPEPASIVNISKSFSKRGWDTSDKGFTTCVVCNQVLVNSDLDKHSLNHGLDKDFPSLGT